MPTVAELKSLAKKNGLKGYSKLRKNELLEFLQDNGVAYDSVKSSHKPSTKPSTKASRKPSAKTRAKPGLGGIIERAINKHELAIIKSMMADKFRCTKSFTIKQVANYICTHIFGEPYTETDPVDYDGSPTDLYQMVKKIKTESNYNEPTAVIVLNNGNILQSQLTILIHFLNEFVLRPADICGIHSETDGYISEERGTYNVYTVLVLGKHDYEGLASEIADHYNELPLPTDGPSPWSSRGVDGGSAKH